MDIFWGISVFVLGAIIGSFLNVVIYRLHTGRSVNGRSHCLSCGEILRWYELIPVLSYLIQRARCRHCASWVPMRYLCVELLTGGVFVLLWNLFAADLSLFVFYAFLAVLLIIILLYDIRHTIIPDEFTLMIGFLAAISLLYRFFFLHVPALSLAADLFAGLAGATFLGGLWYMSHGRWIGLGDAKLALPLGVIVGVSGVFSMIVLSFWVGAGVSLTLLLIQYLCKKGKTRMPQFLQTITMKSEIPFAPFLIAGFFLVQLFHVDIFTIATWLNPFYWPMLF